MIDAREASGWRAFWSRGGFWRALLFVAAYMAIYLAASKVIALVWGGQIDGEDQLSSAPSLFFGMTAAIIVGSVVLLLVGRSLGWLGELFGRQPIGGRWWMWILPIVVLGYNVLRFAAVDYAAFTASTVLMVLVTGLFIGFAEELLTRGFAVDLLRRGGHRELAVALLSSLLFAVSHSLNIFSGQAPLTVAITVVYTFAFGVAMYFTLRVTRNLIWPILLHATTDPSVMLLTGGIDATTDAASTSPLAAFASTANWVVIFLGFTLVWFVRGKVSTTTCATSRNDRVDAAMGATRA